MANKKLTLIPNWKSFLRFASVRINLLGAFLMATASFAEEIFNTLPSWVAEQLPHATTIALVFFVLGIIGRVISLAKPNESSNDEGNKNNS